MKKQKSEVNDRFIQYFQENFFSNMPDEMDIFIDSLTKPLPKTIRINTNRITVEDFKVRATKNNWILTPPHNPTVFRIDRSNITMPL